MKRLRLIAIVLMISLTPSATLFAEGDFGAEGTRLRKLQRGLANSLLGGLEFVHLMKQPDHEQAVPPWLTGLDRSVYYFFKRTFLGLYEVVTFAAPHGAVGYDPLMAPEFPWEYFQE